MEFLIGLVVGAVGGGAFVYLKYGKIKQKVEDTIPGDPPVV